MHLYIKTHVNTIAPKTIQYLKIFIILYINEIRDFSEHK